jgi:hypothetical protein
MGNSQSQTTSERALQVANGVFSNELSLLKGIVNKIINEKDMFHNKDYNFLSHDVCNQHYILLQQELDKHLKIELESLGTSIFVVPRTDDNEKLTKLNLTKKQICQKISSHYIKILYIICLIKYVYDLEHNGDLSIAGIVFRNIKILDDIMEIDFCQIPHKDYQKAGKKITKIDLGLLEGITFFTQFFLEQEESKVFIGLMKSILSRKKQTGLANQICSAIQSKSLNPSEIQEMEKLYTSRFGNKLVCTPQSKVKQEPGTEQTKDHTFELNRKQRVSLNVFIEKDNPIFASRMCYATNQLIVKLNTQEGKKVHEIYKQMKANYDTNIREIQKILDLLVFKDANGEYVLKDIKSHELNNIITVVKTKIKIFYMQSILDYQKLFDTAKEIPNISLVSEK